MIEHITSIGYLSHRDWNVTDQSKPRLCWPNRRLRSEYSDFRQFYLKEQTAVFIRSKVYYYPFLDIHV